MELVNIPPNTGNIDLQPLHPISQTNGEGRRTWQELKVLDIEHSTPSLLLLKGWRRNCRVIHVMTYRSTCLLALMHVKKGTELDNERKVA